MLEWPQRVFVYSLWPLPWWITNGHHDWVWLECTVNILLSYVCNYSSPNDLSVIGPSLSISHCTGCYETALHRVCLPNYNMLQETLSFYDWLSVTRSFPLQPKHNHIAQLWDENDTLCVYCGLKSYFCLVQTRQSRIWIYHAIYCISRFYIFKWRHVMPVFPHMHREFHPLSISKVWLYYMSLYLRQKSETMLCVKLFLH